MNRKIIALLFWVLFFQGQLFAQNEKLNWGNNRINRHTDTLHNSKAYIVSGSIGIGIPMGRTKEVLDAKLASSWGMDISLANRHYVLYPSIDMWSFGYNQQYLNEKSDYLVENARATFYNVNLAVGTRRQFQQLNIYATIGPTIGLFFEPRATILANNVIRNDFDSSIKTGARISIGTDYKFKSFFVYADAGWLHSFSKIQDHPLNILSFYIGLKTDITRVADAVVTVFGRDRKERSKN